MQSLLFVDLLQELADGGASMRQIAVFSAVEFENFLSTPLLHNRWLYENEGALSKRFMRHHGIYRSDVSFLLFTPGACPASRSGRCLSIVRDKFQPAIPRSGCSPALPVSASPTRAS
jgi:hypothetical protein